MRALALRLLSAFVLASSACAAPPNLSAASYYVSSLPGLPDNPIQRLHIYAGHIPSDPNAATAPPTAVLPHIFFALVKARRTADKERVIFWFNGGPGCSSFDGLMMEIGPWRMDHKGGLQYVEGGWEEYANVVFVDQPPGTGLSYTSSDKYLHELTEASSHVVQFMRTFYDIFPDFKVMDTYLAGESYAGQFIPYIADAILSSALPTRLKGVAIGNGWIDPLTQYPAYIDFALAKGLTKTGSQDHKTALKYLDVCMTTLNTTTNVPTASPQCELIMGSLTDSLIRTVDGQRVCLNSYDIRLTDTYPACGMNWPPDLHDIYPYLGRRDVVAALHATDRKEAWTECSGSVGHAMRNTKSPASITILPRLIARIPVMLFAGDQDYICNYMGIESLIAAMTWNGARGFGDIKPTPWSVNNTPAGTWTIARNLTYVKVYNSSHMVPYDVPHAAHDMMLRFMGVDFSAVTGGSARIPSSLGNMSKPVLLSGSDGVSMPPPGGAKKTPQEQQAMWDAYYNAGSVALVLLLIGIAIALFFMCRRRRSNAGSLRGLPDEETIPLSVSVHDNGHADDEPEPSKRRRRAPEAGTAAHEAIFDVGDSDSENSDSRERR